VKLNPDFAEARVALARSLVASGAKTEAEKQYQEALRILKLQRNIASDGDKAIDRE